MTIPHRPSERGTDPGDYQDLPRPVVAMAKSFAAGAHVAPHDHPRDQLLYAIGGSMWLETDRETWIVPPARAVYIPAGTRHSVRMRGAVEMRTLYLAPGPTLGLPAALTVIEVPPLLKELILALLEEPVVYDEEGRGGAIARLIVAEIARAPELPLVVPLPRDPRLKRLCAALMEDPSRDRPLEGWAPLAGASPRTLARLFERELGMSFGQWRQRVRLHGALEALSRGEAIAHVAERHGYRSASAFSAAFTKLMGIAPSRVKANAGSRPQDNPAGSKS